MKKLFLLVAFVAASCSSASADLVILGRINNGSPDSFTFTPLINITAGQTYYFTDNGWTGTQFRNTGATQPDGDGNEGLIKFTASGSIVAGTLISSLDTTNPLFAWTKSGLVPGASIGSFADLALSQTGDQIYGFSGPINLPLQNWSAIHFVLDDTNGFEAATSAGTGNKPSGTLGLTLNPTTLAGGLRLINDGIARDRAGWEAYVTNTSNWTSGAAVNPNDTGNLLFISVPEPSSLGLLGLGAFGLSLFTRRRFR
jgi:PEP-CTERM motif